MDATVLSVSQGCQLPCRHDSLTAWGSGTVRSSSQTIFSPKAFNKWMGRKGPTLWPAQSAELTHVNSLSDIFTF